METVRRLVLTACIVAALGAVLWLTRGFRGEAGVPDTTSTVEVVTSGPDPRPSTVDGADEDLTSTSSAGTSRAEGGAPSPWIAPAAVTGIVLDDATDAPIAGVTVELRPMAAAAIRGAPVPDGELAGSALSDVEGRFRVAPGEGVASNWWRLRAAVPGYAVVAVRTAGLGGEVEFRLPKAGALEVRVVGGEPRRAAHIVTVRMGDTVFEATGRGSAAVEFSRLPPGRADVRVGSRDGGAVRAGPVVIRVGETTTLDVSLSSLAGVDGVVVDLDSGLPIHGATVRAASPGRSTAPVRTGADGRFRIPTAGGHGERILVSVDADRYAPTLAPVVIRPGGDQGAPQTVQITLERAAPWQGDVLGTNGRPVAGATVRYTGNGIVGRTPARVTTDERGSFEIPPPPPPAPGRRVVLVAEKDGAVATLALRPGQPAPRPLLLHLDRGATVSGRIVDAEGKPVSGALLRLWPDRERGVAALSPARHRLRLSNERGFADLASATDADGRFVISGAPRARFDLELRFRNNTHWPAEPFFVDGDSLDLGTLGLGSGAELNGLVLTARGDPVAGAQVQLAPAGGQTRRPRITTTNEAGEYGFQDLRSGAYLVSSSLPDHAEATADVSIEGTAPVTLDLRLESHPTLEVRLAGTGALGDAVRVQLRAPDGRAVNAPRTVRPTKARRFSLHVPPGRWWIEVTAGDLLGTNAEPAEVFAGQHAQTVVELKRASAIEGRVIDRGGSPIKEARLSFVHATRGTRFDATGGADGRYRLSPVSPGTWRVHIGGRGGVPDRREITVAPEEVHVEDFVLEAGGTVRVKVLSDDGAPQRGALLVFRTEARAYPSSPPDRTDDHGRAERRHLPPGPIAVQARLDGWVGVSEVVVKENDVVDVTVVIAPIR